MQKLLVVTGNNVSRHFTEHEFDKIDLLRKDIHNQSLCEEGVEVGIVKI